jgi:hypothetical protein
MEPSDHPRRRNSFVPSVSPHAGSFEFPAQREANDLCYRATSRLESLIPPRSRRVTERFPPPMEEQIPAEPPIDSTVHPRKLAELLEAWALRREKVLHLLDLRAARAARALAVECRRLGYVPDAEMDRARWRAVRERVAELLAR